MITKPTTLILGAGASTPFGFPTGNALLQRVLSMIKPTQNQIPREFLTRFPREQIILFGDSLFKSGKSSIDAFLEHRPEFIEIGKLAIALALIPFENEAALFEENGKNWYKYLFNQLNAKFEDFENNKLSILTFNYDRSLEHYLFTALKNSYPRNPSECLQKLKSIPIIHLHGDLGELPALNQVSARYYNQEINDHILQIATNRIKIIHEDVANEQQFKHAKEILSQSWQVCFLGFGYHEMNLNRLGFDNDVFCKNVHVHGSTYGLTNSERNYIKAKRLRGRLIDTNPRVYGLEVLDFLRETGILLL